jgi:DNA-binding response OmpR family regulator
MARVLVVEDVLAESELLNIVLTRAGHEVRTAGTAWDAVRSFQQQHPEIAILDIGLPDGSGFDVCATIRQSSQIPILFLTARRSLEDKVRGFRVGADDFVVKPYLPSEIVLRVDALLRRAAWSPPPPPVERFGDLEIDRASRVVRRAGKPVKLSPMEIELLIALASTPGAPWPADKLARRLGVGTDNYATSSEIIRMKVSRLRRKLEPDPRRPLYLHSHRRSGYLLAWKNEPDPTDE